MDRKKVCGATFSEPFLQQRVISQAFGAGAGEGDSRILE